MIMATLRVKPRAKPAEGNANQAPATLNHDNRAEEKGETQHAAGASPASYGSLREYLKTNHWRGGAECATSAPRPE
jgi:hypothetical protein